MTLPILGTIIYPQPKRGDDTVLRIPHEFVTQTAAIIARKSGGKTYTGSVLVENLLHESIPVVVIDPLDVWWGLRSSADGKSKGYPIVVFGGDHADLPLMAEMGLRIADMVVDHGISAVLSLRHLSKSGQRTFVTAFAERLYHRKAPEKHRNPLHVVIDEADLFAPQRVMHGAERMLGAIDDLVRRGRASGIGSTLITQRPATLNKDVLTQIDTLIALQLLAPQDRKAVDEWIQTHDEHDRRQVFLESLASFQQGEAWVWSPGWLKCFVRIQVRKRETFDSSATPKMGAKPAKPKVLAPIELDALREQLADVVKQAEENDPAKLKREIAELRKQLAKKGAPQPPVADRTASLERAQQRLITEIGNEINNFFKMLQTKVSAVSDLAEGTNRRLCERLKLAQLAPSRHRIEVSDTTKATTESTGTLVFPPDGGSFRIHGPDRTAPPGGVSIKTATTAAGFAKLSGGQRKILTVLAHHQGAPMTNSKLALLAGYSGSSGTWATLLSSLRNPEGGEPYIDGGGQAGISATPLGLAALGPVDDLPAGRERIEYWRGKIGGGMPRRIFDALVEAYPEPLSKSRIGELIGASHASGTFATALSRLNTLELIEGRGDQRRASSKLMEPIG